MSDLRIRLMARRIWRRYARHRLPRPPRHRQLRHRTFLSRYAGTGWGRGTRFHLRRRFFQPRRKP